MAKPRRHTSVRDMSEPVKGKRGKRQSKPPSYRGGIAGTGTPVTAVSSTERDWYAEGRCSTCHRETPKKILTRNVTLEDKALCSKCFDKVPTHLRRLPTPKARKRWEYQPVPLAPKKTRRERERLNREANNNLDTVPGTTLEEKLDTIDRGLVPETEPRLRRIWLPEDEWKRKRQHGAVEPPEVPAKSEPDPERWCCDECGRTGQLDQIQQHGLRTGHLFRSRLAVD